MKELPNKNVSLEWDLKGSNAYRTADISMNEFDIEALLDERFSKFVENVVFSAGIDPRSLDENSSLISHLSITEEDHVDIGLCFGVKISAKMQKGDVHQAALIAKGLIFTVKTLLVDIAKGAIPDVIPDGCAPDDPNLFASAFDVRAMWMSKILSDGSFAFLSEDGKKAVGGSILELAKLPPVELVQQMKLSEFTFYVKNSAALLHLLTKMQKVLV